MRKVPAARNDIGKLLVMNNILLIETSTELCSAALCENGEITAYRESTTPRSHASLTAVFVDEILKENGLKVSDLSGVCVSEGPGSYTGLRVGVSTAKGLCFGGGVPLLAVGTLDVLVAQVENASEYKYIVPMIDARRMEVYTAVFSGEGDRLSEIEARIIDASSFEELLEQGPVLFVGDAAAKCENTILHPNARFLQILPKASAMAGLAEKELAGGRFRDVAYFEPFYLKEFVATVSRKRL